MQRRNKYKLPMSASHITLYIGLFIYMLIAILGVGGIIYCFLQEYIPEAINLCIALFSYTGVIGSTIIAFYCNKAKKEHEDDACNRKYDKRLNLAMELCDLIRNQEINEQSIEFLQALISDSEVHVQSNGWNTTVTETTQYGNSVDNIIDDQLG